MAHYSNELEVANSIPVAVSLPDIIIFPVPANLLKQNIVLQPFLLKKNRVMKSGQDYGGFYRSAKICR